jgi:hypothetical protein|tara:strand:- start:1305 stop:1544 length:240 start_codon:yes stop_codon:yes gene_type:complete
MKPQKNDIKLFNEIKSKYNLKEGILSMLFKKKLSKALKQDKTLNQALEDGDKALADLKKNLDKLEAKGYTIPSALKKYI